MKDSRTEYAMPNNRQIDPFAFGHSQYLNDLNLEKRIREYQHNHPLPGSNYPYLNVSKPENAISENLQIDNIAGRNNPNVNDSKP